MSDNDNKLTPSQTKLINNAIDIRSRDVFERDELGFATRMFVQCCLPHRDPGDVPAWIRVNGNLCLTITPVRYAKHGTIVNSGYPYGNVPRLLFFYICSQAVQTKSKEISLDKSLSAFIQKLGLDVTGGENGTINRVKDQLKRLVTANIDFTYNETIEGNELFIFKKAIIASQMRLWGEKNPDNNITAFDRPQFPKDSCLVLTDEFYNEIMSYAIPVDMGIISAIKQSPLALDLYSWLTYRIASIYKPTRISWKSLAQQIGADYSDLKDFGKYVKINLYKIFSLWPEIKVDIVKGGIILKPSKTSVPQKVFAFANPIDITPE